MHETLVRRPRTRRPVTAVVVLLATMVAGCGSADRADARAVAVEFEQSLAAEAAGHACELLAPRTKSGLEESSGDPCPSAILAEDLPTSETVRGAEAFGTMAQVRFVADVVFLAQFQGGWKVVAAGCEPRPDLPYDCLLGG